MKEGEIYTFLLKKKVSLPDGSYYIIVDELGRQYLMNASYYDYNYSFVENTYIQCYIDKINCSGKIFMEPMHPKYKPNDVDIFDIVEVETRKKKKTGDLFQVVLAKNNYAPKAAIENLDEQTIKKLINEKRVKAKVLRITKGELRLTIDF